MWLRLLLAFTLIPLAELWLLLRIGAALGGVPTLGLVLITLGHAPAPAAIPGDQTSALPRDHTDVRNLVFFAALEGLYLDGVDTETAELLATVDEKSGAPRYFIYSCPLCMPALDAVRLYAGRPKFYGDKGGRARDEAIDCTNCA